MNEDTLVTIPRGEYDRLTAKQRPAWYKRHLVSIIASSATTLVLGGMGIYFNHNNAGRFRLLESRLDKVEETLTDVRSDLTDVRVNVGIIEGRIRERFGPAATLPKRSPKEKPQEGF